MIQILLLLQDPSADELLRNFERRVLEARTVRVAFTVEIAGAGDEPISGTLRVKGRDRWSVSVESGGRGLKPFSVSCDGRKVTDSSGALSRRKAAPLDRIGQELRKSAVHMLLFPLVLGQVRDWDDLPPESHLSITDVKDLGKEKVGEVEVRTIEYTLEYDWEMLRGDALQVKLSFDPSRGLPVKRTISVRGMTWTETYAAFAVNEEMDDSEFSFQTPTRLAAARLRQLAKSAELFTLYTGRLPRTLDELAKRPEWLEQDVFWPEGGFTLGPVPKDPWGRSFLLEGRKLSCLGADGKAGKDDPSLLLPTVTRRPIGAPTDEIAKHLNARVRIHLLTASIRAFRETYAELPRKKSVLWERPEWAVVWPEGGWLPGGLPTDPWGDPYRIISDPESVRVQVRDPAARALAPTKDEERALEELSRPRITDAERREIAQLMERLSEEELDERDRAEEALRAWGPAIAPFARDRLKTERDSDATARLKKILAICREPKAAWRMELAVLRMRIGTGQAADAETRCLNNLSMLWKMMNNYMVQFGGPQKRMPSTTGKDFWLELSRTTPKLIDDSLRDLYVCPASEDEPGEGVCAYWGPGSDVNALGDGDPVGMCDHEGHGDSVMILRKSGDAMIVSRGDPLHVLAAERLKK